MSEKLVSLLDTLLPVVKTLRLEKVTFDGLDLLQLIRACSRLSSFTIREIDLRSGPYTPGLMEPLPADMAVIVPVETIEIHSFNLG